MEKTGKIKASEQDASCLNLLMEPSFIVDEKKVITWANQTFFDQFNFTDDAVITDYWWSHYAYGG